MTDGESESEGRDGTEQGPTSETSEAAGAHEASEAAGAHEASEAAGAHEVSAASETSAVDPYKVRGLVETDASGGDNPTGILGRATGTGRTYGVQGVTESDAGFAAGVFGRTTSASGQNYGVHGVTGAEADDAAGVRGEADAAGARAYGVLGSTTATATDAAGLRGEARNLDGKIHGVSGRTDSSALGAAGVKGRANNADGQTYGVLGETNSDGDRSSGLRGKATADSGATYGGFGTTRSGTDGAAGLRGEARTLSGAVDGVSGKTDSSGDGAAGVRGVANNASGRSAGVVGTTNSTATGAAGVVGRQGADGTDAVLADATDHAGGRALVARNDAAGTPAVDVEGGVSTTTTEGVALSVSTGDTATYSNTDPAGHAALVESTNADADNQVLALRTAYTGNPGSLNHFVTFFDGNDAALGSIQGDGSGGINFNSSGADFAERLPLADGSAALDPGDVVGVTDGHLSRRTADADAVAVVSTSPIVTGNDPGDGADLDDHEPVAFVGQVPAKVRGPVEHGDLVVPSGEHDGTARAVAPDEWTPGTEPLVGQAWEDDEAEGVGEVTVAVGVDAADALGPALAASRERVADLEAEATALRAENDELRDRLATLERRVAEVAGTDAAAPADD